MDWKGRNEKGTHFSVQFFKASLKRPLYLIGRIVDAIVWDCDVHSYWCVCGVNEAHYPKYRFFWWISFVCFYYI